MPLELKATWSDWMTVAVTDRVLRARGNFKAVDTHDKIKLLPWSAYEKADTRYWEDLWPCATPEESLELMEEAWARKEADLRSMPGGEDIELFRDNMSLPQLARYLGYKQAESHGYAFFLPKKADEGERVEGTLQRNIAGGPSVVFDRVVDDRAVYTFDANSLYGWCLMQDMPIGRHLFEMDGTGLKVLGKRQSSLGERSWISSLRKQGHHVDTADNLPTKRVRVKGASGKSYTPDGIDRRTRTVYEYLGDHWHGGANLPETEAKIRDMEDAGWTVVTMWESEWATPDRLDAAAKEYYPPYAHMHYQKREDPALCLAPERVSENIVRDVLFGFVEVDVEWAGPEPPPPFPGLFFKRDDRLTHSHSAQSILLHTAYVRTLITRGYRLIRVHRIWEFHRGRPFAEFVERAVEERQKNTQAAATWKLLVNSLYGGFLMNMQERQTLKITKSDLGRSALVLNTLFREMEHVEGSDSACVFMATARKLMTAPTHLGKTVLDLAKARMVAFYHDVIKPAGGVIVSMDTDSFTFHMDPSVRLADAVPLAVREEWFDDPDEPDRLGPKKRGTPGLFHLESKGNSARAVGPKRVCVTDNDVPVKVSHAGVKRSALPLNPMSMYDAMCQGSEFSVAYPERRMVAGKCVLQERHVTMSAR
jgi:hypothetical protein